MSGAAIRGAPGTVLLGWELGGGLGHVRPLLQLARALAAEGLEPVLAVKDLVTSHRLLRDAPFPIVQAPVHIREQSHLSMSYADILALHDFDDPDRLLAQVQGWQGLIDLVRPALVVAEHSPTLCLAAHGGLPVVMVGTGFTVPPAHGPMFPQFPRLVDAQAVKMPQDAVLAVVREVQTRRGRPLPDRLPGLFATAGRFVTELPELDAYAESRDAPAVGPLTPLPPPLPPAEPRFFAYLDALVGSTEAVLTGLVGAGWPGRAYVRSADEPLRRRFRDAGLEILDGPLPEEDLLREAAVIVHHGGSGLSNAALAAGRLQLVCPAYLEQLLTAQRLYQLGVAHYLVNPSPELTAEGLHVLFTDGPLAERARAVAAGVHARGPWQPLPSIVAHCRQLAKAAEAGYDLEALIDELGASLARARAEGGS